MNHTYNDFGKLVEQIGQPCHSCSNKALSTTRYCLRCWIKDCVRKTLGVKQKDEKERLTDLLYQKLKKQNHRCVYTGRVLIAGVNLSLDHILPKSQFANLNTNLDNLVWVDLSVNVAKNKLLPKDFLSMCEDVVVYRSDLLQCTSQKITQLEITNS